MMLRLERPHPGAHGSLYNIIGRTRHGAVIGYPAGADITDVE
jgi:hypothetical protein